MKPARPKAIGAVFFLLFFTAAIFTTPFSVFAQENTSLPEGAVVVQSAALTIEEAKLEKPSFNAGEKLSGSFKLINVTNKVQSRIFYRLSVQTDIVDDDAQTLVDEIWSKELTFKAQEEKVITIDNSLPENLPTANYNLKVEARTQEGDPIAFDNVRFTVEGNNRYVRIKDLFIIDAGERVFAGGGRVFEPSSVVRAEATLENLSSEAISAVGKLKIYERASINKPIQELTLDRVDLAPKQKTTIDFDLPKLEQGEVYFAYYSLFDDSGERVSSLAGYRWVIAGLGARILKIEIDKSGYAAGEAAQVYVTFAGNLRHDTERELGSADLKVDLVSGSGASVGSSTVQVNLDKDTKATLSVPVSKNINDGEVKAVITKDGNELDSSSILIAGTTSEQIKVPGIGNISKSKVFLGIFAVLIVAGVVAILYFKKRSVICLVGLIFGLTLFLLHVKGVSASLLLVDTTGGFFGDDHTSTYRIDASVTHPDHNQVIRPGENHRFRGQVFQPICNNSFSNNRFDFYWVDQSNLFILRSAAPSQSSSGSSETPSYDRFSNAYPADGQIGGNYPKKIYALASFSGTNAGGGGTSAHTDSLNVYEHMLVGPSASHTLTESRPACSDTNYSSITFNWQNTAPKLVTEYFVDVSESPTFSGCWAYKSVNGGTSSSYSTGGLAGWQNTGSCSIAQGGALSLNPEKTYYWRVYSSNENGPVSGIHSQVRTLPAIGRCTQQEPSSNYILLGAPQGICEGGTAKVKLTWGTDISGASQFDIAKNGTYYTDNGPGGGTIWISEPLPYNTTFTWKVRNHDWTLTGGSPVESNPRTGNTLDCLGNPDFDANDVNSELQFYTDGTYLTVRQSPVFAPNEPMFVKVKVNNKGGNSGLFYTGFYKDDDQPVCDQVPDRSTPVLALASGATHTWSFPTNAPATAGVKTASSFADYLCDVPEVNETNNIRTKTYEVNVSAWFMTTRGDVGAIGTTGISHNSPPSPQSEYLLVAKNTTNAEGLWELNNYTKQLVPPGGVYEFFDNRFGAKARGPEGQPCNFASPPAEGAFYYCGTPGTSTPLTIDPGYPMPTSGAAIVFVDGDLNILKNFDLGSASVVFVVSGVIRVHDSVTAIDGVYVTNGSFIDCVADCSAVTSPLDIDGAVYAAKFFSGGSRVLASGNSTTPALRVDWSPRYLITLSGFLGTPSIEWKEVAP